MQMMNLLDSPGRRRLSNWLKDTCLQHFGRAETLPNTPENVDDKRRNRDRKKGKCLAQGFPAGNGPVLLLVILRLSVDLTHTLLYRHSWSQPPDLHMEEPQLFVFP